MPETSDKPAQSFTRKRTQPKAANNTNKQGVDTDTIVVALFQNGAGPFASIGHKVVDRIRKDLEVVCSACDGPITLDVWLDSPGGDAHSAYKLGLIFRSVASRIRVVVPDYAKSAATLLSLVADEIYMAPAAELGPLDAQIGYEQEGMTISALDRAQSIDDLTRAAMDIVLGGGAAVLQNTRLSRAETMNAMLDFAAKFLNPVVAKLDPTILHWSGTLLDVAVEYGRRLILTRSDCDEAQADSIPRRLVTDYPTHGFVISYAEAETLGLPVRPAADYPHWSNAQQLHSQATDNGTNIIVVLPRPAEAHKLREEPTEEGGKDDSEADGPQARQQQAAK